MLARPQRFDDQGTVGPALGEDRHRVHVGGEQSVDAVDHARQVLLDDQLLGALRAPGR